MQCGPISGIVSADRVPVLYPKGQGKDHRGLARAEFAWTGWTPGETGESSGGPGVRPGVTRILSYG